MRVVVFGASGKVGRILVGELLKNGHNVTAFVHKSSPFAETPKLRLLRGDIYSPEDVTRAVQDCDAVASVLGSWGTRRKDVVSSGMLNIIAGMKANGVRRVVSLTGSDAVATGDSRALLSKFTHFLINLTPARKVLLDGERHIQLLEKSGLDWTVLRSPAMTNPGDPQMFKITNVRPKPWATVNRKSVALAMAELLKNTSAHRKATYINQSK